ncbi:MAG: hypothetical protein II886_02965 [Prevotella sp.]|nr:hypothetical protein [Prevotella sp.]
MSIVNDLGQYAQGRDICKLIAKNTVTRPGDGSLICSAHVETATPQPADATLPAVVDLKAQVTPNRYGGIHIQHTGSSGGESTTMLHRLLVEWK